MSTSSLEDRVAMLESRFTELLRMVQGRPPAGAWRKVVGLFGDDPQIEQLQKEIARIREEDRQAARQDES